MLRFLLFCCIFASAHAHNVLICGICKDVEPFVENAIAQIEALGQRFDDYRVIVYENNSTDNTASLFATWAQASPKVLFVSETVEETELPPTRMEKIARARNRVLDFVREGDFKEFPYLIMADLDFQGPWPIDAVIETIQSPLEWDAVSANGMLDNFYYDRYAFRDWEYPLGPELLGSIWWQESYTSRFFWMQDSWAQVYSGFGGLAIYKTPTITQFAYSGTVTVDLRAYYRAIITSIPPFHPQLKKYLENLGLDPTTPPNEVPIVFCPNTPEEHPPGYKPVTCCEHLPLHASMSLKGYGRFYVNPKMRITYQRN